MCNDISASPTSNYDLLSKNVMEQEAEVTLFSDATVVPKEWDCFCTKLPSPKCMRDAGPATSRSVDDSFAHSLL